MTRLAISKKLLYLTQWRGEQRKCTMKNLGIDSMLPEVTSWIDEAAFYYCTFVGLDESGCIELAFLALRFHLIDTTSASPSGPRPFRPTNFTPNLMHRCWSLSLSPVNFLNSNACCLVIVVYKNSCSSVVEVSLAFSVSTPTPFVGGIWYTILKSPRDVGSSFCWFKMTEKLPNWRSGSLNRSTRTELYDCTFLGTGLSNVDVSNLSKAALAMLAASRWPLKRAPCIVAGYFRFVASPAKNSLSPTGCAIIS